MKRRYIHRRTTKGLEKLEDPQEKISKEQAYNGLRKQRAEVGNEQNEISKFKDWGLDIEPHRLKMNTRDLETDFKDENTHSDSHCVCNVDNWF